MLLLQVRQPFLHGLDLQFEFRQIGLQFGNLFGLGLVTAMEAARTAIAATVAAAGAFCPALAVAMLAVTGFFVRHIVLLIYLLATRQFDVTGS
jgi:hypothetical protein